MFMLQATINSQCGILLWKIKETQRRLYRNLILIFWWKQVNSLGILEQMSSEVSLCIIVHYFNDCVVLAPLMKAGYFYSSLRF